MMQVRGQMKGEPTFEKLLRHGLGGDKVINEVKLARWIGRKYDLALLYHMARGKNSWHAMEKICGGFNLALCYECERKSRAVHTYRNPDTGVLRFYETLNTVIREGDAYQ